MNIEITDAPRWREADVQVSFTHDLNDRQSSAQTVALTIEELRQLRDKINERLGEH